MVDSSNGGRGRDEQEHGFNHSFGVDLAHDFGGAILFSFPLLMTMEMWWLGFYMDRLRLALFLALAFVMVMGLSYFEGGEETFKIAAVAAARAEPLRHSDWQEAMTLSADLVRLAPDS